MTTITSFTKERITNLLEFNSEGSDCQANAEEWEVHELARIALASLEAEPVAWTEKCEITNMQATGLYLRGFPDNSQGRDIALYTAPPVPVVLPCAVELKPGLIIGKGCKTETLLTALRRRADYYAEIDAMTPEERAEHDASIEAFKAMLPKPAQPDIEMLTSALRNAPLAPSDSQGRPRAPVVPSEITDDLMEQYLMSDKWADSFCGGWNACRDAMLQNGSGGTNGKPLTITLPDITSKAFWSGTGKSEVFHPETYKRWVKEAVERYCAIGRIDVEVK